MHICFLCWEYPPGSCGGVGIFTQGLARALVSEGLAVTVVGSYSRPDSVEENDAGVRVIRLPHARIPGMRFFANAALLRRTLARIARHTPIDVLEGPEIAFSAIPKQFPSRKIIRMHGGHHFYAVTLGRRPALWRGWHERRSFAAADHLCGVSRYVAEKTRALLHLGAVPIEILPNPVDVDVFRPRQDISEIDGRVVYVGTICERKGVRQLVQAMPYVIRAFPRAQLIALGRDSLDPATGRSYAETLRSAVPAEFRSAISFRGHVENHEVAAYLAQASVCVYPSHMEAMPVAWLEGLAMGKPVVASDVGPARELIEDGVSGLLCNPHDPASIADRIIAVLKDDGLRRRLGAAARQRAVEKFSLDKLLPRNIAFYQRCLNHGRA